MKVPFCEGRPKPRHCCVPSGLAQFSRFISTIGRSRSSKFSNTAPAGPPLPETGGKFERVAMVSPLELQNLPT